MTNEIATQEVLFTVSTPTTGFTVSVASCNLDSNLTIKDFVVYNNTTEIAISTTLWNKTSSTVLTYIGPVITTGDVLRIGRSTLLDRVQRTIQLGSTISSSILNAEILRLYKLIAEKLSGFVVTNPVNNVTRRTYEPNIAPIALGDEWHQYTAAGSSAVEDTIRLWVATDTTGSIDELGWFEVTGIDGADGTDGATATITVGTVTTGAPGSNVTFTNVGSSTAAVFNVSIPRGDTGALGNSTSSSGFMINEIGSVPTTADGQLALYTQDAGTNLSVRLENNGAQLNLATLSRAQTYTASQVVQAVALTDTGSIATNAALGNVFTITLTGNSDLAAPTNLVSGGTYLWVITQDATGSRLLTFNAAFKFPGGVDGVLSTAVNSVDLLSCVCNGSDSLLCNLTKAFA